MWGLSVLGGSLLYMLDEKGFFHLEHFIYVVGVLSTFCSCVLVFFLYWKLFVHIPRTFVWCFLWGM